ncbi:hypothetical protein D1007_20636 [Hordeum vulgare]|nr:hypothetical protein D1007_20636 [Hordeum vulgare]
MLEPRDGERVGFGMHFIVEFGLPARRFLRQFLDFFRLQMHHLGLNSMLYLAYLTTVCEEYLGLWAFLALFHLFFHFRA